MRWLLEESQAGRTWVILSEAAEGGWGIAGTAYGKEEFGALAGSCEGVFFTLIEGVFN
jgi:hypothetical protein